jgi:hypothetical protein
MIVALLKVAMLGGAKKQSLRLVKKMTQEITLSRTNRTG